MRDERSPVSARDSRSIASILRSGKRRVDVVMTLEAGLLEAISDLMDEMGCATIQELNGHLYEMAFEVAADLRAGKEICAVDDDDMAERYDIRFMRKLKPRQEPAYAQDPEIQIIEAIQ